MIWILYSFIKLAFFLGICYYLLILGIVIWFYVKGKCDETFNEMAHK